VRLVSSSDFTAQGMLDHKQDMFKMSLGGRYPDTSNYFFQILITKKKRSGNIIAQILIR
jgi:hypothetical protein